MMNDFEFDVQLRKTLHDCADPLKTDDNMKGRIDMMIQQNQKKGKKTMWKRVTVGLAAALCLTTVGALARGNLSALVSSVQIDQMETSVSALQKDADQVFSGIQVPEKLADFDFKSGTIQYIDKLDDNGSKLGSYPDLSAYYGSKNELSFSARLFDEELDGDRAAPSQQYEGQPREDREIDGVTVHYQSDRYIFLPPDEKPTAEEQKLEDNNELYISYGSDKREESNFQWAKWQQGDTVYSIFSGSNSDELTAEDLFAAAKDVIEAK